MYLLRHFASTMRNLILCTVRLQFRFCAAWLSDLLVWLNDSARFLLYSSHNVKCDCCGWQGDRFFLLTIISGKRVYRLREICPRCLTLGRQRQLVRYIGNNMSLSSPSTPTILHIGPSKAVTEWFVKQGITNIITIDLRPDIAMLRMDITQLAFRDEIFDIILCSHVLEHIPRDLVAMGEILRVMKVGGVCMIQVPIQIDLLKTVEYGKTNPEEFDHVRAYGQDFESRMSSTGFELRYAEIKMGEGMFEMAKPRPTSS